MFQENKARQIFRKTIISYLPIRTHKCLIFGKFDLLCFLEPPVLRFALLPYYRHNDILANVLHHNQSLTVFVKKASDNTTPIIITETDFLEAICDTVRVLCHILLSFLITLDLHFLQFILFWECFLMGTWKSFLSNTKFFSMPWCQFFFKTRKSLKIYI